MGRICLRKPSLWLSTAKFIPSTSTTDKRTSYTSSLKFHATGERIFVENFATEYELEQHRMYVEDQLGEIPYERWKRIRASLEERFFFVSNRC